MFRPSSSLPGLLALVLIVGALMPSPARAIDITVDIGGTPTVFDVVFFPGGESFASNATVLRNTPWHGNATLAQDFAVAYRDQVATPYPFADTGSEDFLFFNYADNGASTDSQALSETGTVSNSTSFPAVNDTFPFIHFAYVNAAAPVPEIDGGALGQGAVILLAVWLLMRRRRHGLA